MIVLDVVRGVAFIAFVYCALVSLGAWAIRAGHLNQFGHLGQTIRRITDPPLRPIERWLVQRGANPQGAGWWLLGISVVAGIVSVSIAGWLVDQALRFSSARARGPAGVAQLIIILSIRLVTIALLVRAVGSWFGRGRSTGWMRPFFLLTDWIVLPLRRIVPPVQRFDISPLVAYVLLSWLVLPILMQLF